MYQQYGVQQNAYRPINSHELRYKSRRPPQDGGLPDPTGRVRRGLSILRVDDSNASNIYQQELSAGAQSFTPKAQTPRRQPADMNHQRRRTSSVLHELWDDVGFDGSSNSSSHGPSPLSSFEPGSQPDPIIEHPHGMPQRRAPSPPRGGTGAHGGASMGYEETPPQSPKSAPVARRRPRRKSLGKGGRGNAQSRRRSSGSSNGGYQPVDDQDPPATSAPLARRPGRRHRRTSSV